MNTIYVPAFAAFGGSAFGAISTIVTGWVTRRRRVRERYHAHAVSKREKLYRCFIEHAAERAGRRIIETYLAPNTSFVDLPGFMEEMDPLREFGEACRREMHAAPAR
ncbi:hypothetical protein [Bradyrhizobium sp. CSA207]|uniref:hypothetical protein n=1 Tax=Bradyrhizobium sp. CSA207 TaxID=2698826 RepID=UPI0023AFB936|nr:hypothetical protein [Bradyrhizobium sp. CSA207]